MTAASIKARLLPARYVPVSGDATGEVTNVDVLQRMSSGRVAVARITLTTGVVDVRGWDNLRRVLGAPTASTPAVCPGRTAVAAGFVLTNPSIIDPFTNADGTFGGVIAWGGGWGHNVGLSQFGAHGRGLAGQTFLQILNAYYTGVDIGSYALDIRGAGAGGPSTIRQEFVSPTGNGVLEVRPRGLRALRVHFNETYDLNLNAEDLAQEVVRIDVSAYLNVGLNVVQYNPVGTGGDATVLVIVD